jgi:hypothetical protein
MVMTRYRVQIDNLIYLTESSQTDLYALDSVMGTPQSAYRPHCFVCRLIRKHCHPSSSLTAVSMCVHQGLVLSVGLQWDASVDFLWLQRFWLLWVVSTVSQRYVHLNILTFSVCLKYAFQPDFQLFIEYFTLTTRNFNGILKLEGHDNWLFYPAQHNYFQILVHMNSV